MNLRERLFSSVDMLGRLGCKMPRLANLFLEFSLLRQTIGRLFGVTTRRPLPHFATERFDHWFAKRPPFRAAYRGRVMLWDDTFVRYHEPHIGMAAVKVLEAAGFEVVLPIASQVLRTARLQPGQPGRSRAAGPAQSRPAEPGPGQHAHHFPRAVMLFDVRGGLSRVETAGTRTGSPPVAFCSSNLLRICWIGSPRR